MLAIRKLLQLKQCTVNLCARQVGGIAIFELFFSTMPIVLSVYLNSNFRFNWNILSNNSHTVCMLYRAALSWVFLSLFPSSGWRLNFPCMCQHEEKFRHFNVTKAERKFPNSLLFLLLHWQRMECFPSFTFLALFQNETLNKYHWRFYKWH